MIILTLGVDTAFVSVACALGIDSGLVPLILLTPLLEDPSFLLVHFVVEILVVVVASECLLHILLVEQQHVLLDLLAVLVLPFAVCVVRIEIISVGRDKWGLKSLVKEVIPGEVAQPRVILYVIWAIKSQSIQGLPLDEAIDKVSSFDGPARGYFVFFDLYLFSENMLSNFPPVSSCVWPPSEHALVANDSH